MRIRKVVTVSTLFWCGFACNKPASGLNATDAGDPRGPSPAIATTLGAYQAGGVIDTSKLSPDSPLKAILEHASDAGPNETYADLANAPLTPLAGTFNNGQVKFEKVLIECTTAGYQVRLTSAKDGEKYFVSFPLAKEPTGGIHLGAPTQVPAATLTVDGVTWRLRHSWAIDFKTYKATPFKNKEAVLGHASGRLIWVARGDHGLKLTAIAGTFTGAPIRARADCKP